MWHYSCDSKNIGGTESGMKLASNRDLQTCREKATAVNGGECFRYAHIKRTVFESTSYSYPHASFLVGGAGGLLLYRCLGKGRGSATLGGGTARFQAFSQEDIRKTTFRFVLGSPLSKLSKTPSILGCGIRVPNQRAIEFLMFSVAIRIAIKNSS
jgi:hypothetical protein